MSSQEVNFAAVKQAVTMEAVLRHYQVDDLQGGRSGRYRGRCPIHQGEGRDAFHVAPEALVEPPEEIREEGWNIALALPERRHDDPDDVEPIE